MPLKAGSASHYLGLSSGLASCREHHLSPSPHRLAPAPVSRSRQNPDLGSACGRPGHENDRRSGPEIDQNG